MFVQIIEFTNLENISQNDAEEMIFFFVGSLKHNGQIISHLLVKSNNAYMLYVTTPKSDSLDQIFDSIHVKSNRDKLTRYFSIKQSKIGINADSQEYCSCETRSAIEMQTHAYDIDSVFTCCACGKPIPLYELPYLDNQSDHWYIVNWQGTYRATDILWLDSLNDRFTGNQLTNVNSTLNKIGINIAKEISEKTGYKCFYKVADLTKKVKFVQINDETVRPCPHCDKPMKYVKFCEGYERFVCEDCKLSSDLPKEPLY